MPGDDRRGSDAGTGGSFSPPVFTRWSDESPEPEKSGATADSGSTPEGGEPAPPMPEASDPMAGAPDTTALDLPMPGAAEAGALEDLEPDEPLPIDALVVDGDATAGAGAEGDADAHGGDADPFGGLLDLPAAGSAEEVGADSPIAAPSPGLAAAGDFAPAHAPAHEDLAARAHRLADRLEALARRLRTEGAGSLGATLEHGDRLDFLLGGILTGYLAAADD